MNPAKLGPIHTTIDADPKAAARQNGENARATRAALATKLTGYFTRIERYTAVGSASTKIRLGAGDRPSAVLLAQAAPVSDAAGALAVTPSNNFAWDATTQAIDVYEPTGLTANTVYTLLFLILEG